MEQDIIVNFPDRIDMHEHRAPTDESVRLLNEMQDKARKNIIASVLVNDNTINGAVIIYQDMMNTSAIPMIYINYKFKFNGKEFKLEDKYNMPRVLEEMSRGELEVFGYNMLKLKIFKVVEQWLKYELVYTLMEKPVDGYKMKKLLEQLQP